MSMGMKKALETVDAMLATLRNHSGTGVMLECCYRAAANAEALGVVLAAARENHTAALVARVNETTARALEMTRRHSFRASKRDGDLGCYNCGGRESDPIHRPVTP
jgi:hypothetical protein